MDIYRVAFIGHRYIDSVSVSRLIDEELDKIFPGLLSENEYVEFYVGRNGDFDVLAASAVKRAQREAPAPNSELTLVLSQQGGNHQKKRVDD